MRKILLLSIVAFSAITLNAQREKNNFQKLDGPEIKLGIVNDDTAQKFKVVGKTEKNGNVSYRLKGKGDTMFEFQATDAEKGKRYRVRSKSSGTFDYMVGNNEKIMIKHNNKTIMADNVKLPANYNNEVYLQIAMAGPELLKAITANNSTSFVKLGDIKEEYSGSTAPIAKSADIKTTGNNNGPEIRIGAADDNSAHSFKLVDVMEKSGNTVYRMKGKGNTMLEFEATEAAKGMRYRVKSKNGGTFDYMVGNNGKVMVKHNNKTIMADNAKIPANLKDEIFLHFAMKGPEVLGALKQNKASSFLKLGDIQSANIYGSKSEAGEPLVGAQGPTGINPNQQSEEEAIANSGILIGGASNGNSQLGSNTYGVINNQNLANSVRREIVKRELTHYDPNVIATYTTGSGNNAIEFTLTKGNTDAKNLKTRALPNQSEEVDDFCLKDFFRTSGETDSWKVFDENGFSNYPYIVPGAIFDLQNYNGSFFTAIEGKDRNNIRIDLVDTNQGTHQTQLVNNPAYISKIRSVGLAPILNNIKSHNYAATISLDSDYERMYNSNQMDIAFGGTVPYVGNSVSFDASYSSNSESEMYNYSVEYMEPYYTLVTSGASVSNGDFFVDEVLNSSSKYGYIHSVTYGRKIMVTFTSSYSLSEIDMAANLDVQSLFGDYHASFSSDSMEEMEKINYSIQIIGGSSNANLTFTNKEGTLETLMQDLTNIQNSGNDDAKDALPIYFTLHTLSGDVVQSDYSPIDTMAETCNPTFKLSLMQIKGKDVNEGNVGDKEIELNGTWRVTQYDNNNNEISSNSYTFAYEDNPIVFHENELNPTKNFSLNSTEAANHLIPITHDDLEGHITIKVYAEDYDVPIGGNQSDDIHSSTHTYDVKEFDQNPVLIINATGSGNDIEFHFQLIQD